MKVYLAGPIQHAADYGKGWRARLLDGDIDHGVDVEYVDPMGKYSTPEMEYHEWTSEDIVSEDLELIADCDAVFVHWLEVPTCGTPQEIFYAHWIPMFAEALRLLGQRVGRGTTPPAAWETHVRDVCEQVGMPQYMLDIVTAINADIPVVVQTTVPPEELSPWLTYHADVIVERIDEGFHWLDNEIGSRESPEVDAVETDYDLVIQ